MMLGCFSTLILITVVLGSTGPGTCSRPEDLTETGACDSPGDFRESGVTRDRGELELAEDDKVMADVDTVKK
jgi:hypothetical protein